MLVIYKKTGKIIRVNDSYGRRLIEQGAAKLLPAKIDLDKLTDEEYTLIVAEGLSEMVVRFTEK